VSKHTRTTKTKTAPPSEVRRWFFEAVQALWPVADGSLSLRKSSCVRPNCQACASGEGHRSYVLYGRGKKKRFSIYVPDELVPDIQAALENGRLLKDLVSEAGVRYTHELKEKRQSRLSQESKERRDDER
jgi:hypothetical protein